MTDPPRPRNTGNDRGMEYDREAPTGIPRWAKVVGIVVAVVALLIVVMLLVGGGSGAQTARWFGCPVASRDVPVQCPVARRDIQCQAAGRVRPVHARAGHRLPLTGRTKRPGRDAPGPGVDVNGAAFREAQAECRARFTRIATTSHDEPTRTAVADAVNKRLSGAGIKVGSAASVSRSEAISEGHLGPIVTIVLAIAVAMGVVGVIGLASTMGANILDRTREFGVMHAIGARPKAVRRIVVAEGVFLALGSLLVAVIPALALTAVLGAGLGNLFFSAPLPFRVSILAAGIWVVLVVLGAVLATDAAATRASRLTVREALAYL